MNKRLVAIAAAATLVGGWSFAAEADRASACSIAPIGIESGFADADVVAIGTLHTSGELAGVFEVEQYFSGSEAAASISFDNRSPQIGADCSLEPTENPLATDGRYLAFLDATGTGATGAYRAGWLGSGMVPIIDGQVHLYDMTGGGSGSLTLDEVRERLEAVGGVAVSRAVEGEASADSGDDSNRAWLIGGGIVAVAAVSGGAVALKKVRG